MQFHTSPSFMLLGKGKNPQSAKWSVRDRFVVAAVLRLREEKCPHCGVPIWWGHSYHSEIEFEVGYSVCHACETLAEQTKDDDTVPGRYAHVKAVHIDGHDHELPSREEGFRTYEKPEVVARD